MTGSFKRTLKRWRESYFVSLLLATIAKPVWRVCRYMTQHIQAGVKRNGVTLQLPNGKTMSIGRDAGVGTASLLFWHGLDGYEAETSEALRFFFSHSSTFVDVGANCGLYSVLAALWNPQIKVIAFEPFAPIFEQFKRNVALNDLNDRIVCENIALSSGTATAVLHVPQSEGRDFEATGTLATDSWQVRHKSPGTEVRAMRFDDYEREHPMRVDLVKIDVEDFEADVLEGMSAVIRRDRPFIVCEILDRNKEHRNERTRKVLESLNYTAYWITSFGYVRVSRFDFERVAFKDFILSPVALDKEVVTDLAELHQQRMRSKLSDSSTAEDRSMIPASD